jgi:serine-type D-Ala-D-Ala carboxypeptidase (penicillin-binding protein 5/6)
MHPLSRVSTRTPRQFTAGILAVLVACSLLLPESASSAGRSSDIVDGRTAAERNISTSALPSVTLKAGLLSDSEGRVLWARNPIARRSMASITKIMTAVVALEHSKLNESVLVPRQAAAIGQSTAYLVAGERLSMRDMLAAMLVKSGNDAATAVAIHVGGTEDQFVTMMNQKARELGLKGTHFVNPHGLDARGQYSNAGDLSTLARYAMSNPAFRDIVAMKKVTVGKKGRRHKLISTDLLLGNYRGAVGVKTGNTDSAGYSVVSAAKRGGVMLYAVVLGTASDTQRFSDAKELLDWGFAHYRPQSLASSGTIVGEAPVSDYLDVSVPAAISQDASAAVLDLNGTIRRTVTITTVKAPIKVGDRVGSVTFTQGGKLIAGMPLVATREVRRPNPFLRVYIGTVRLWRALFGAPASD